MHRRSFTPHMAAEYPRTEHLAFSPQVASDDIVRQDSVTDPLLNCDAIVTEKLDGGNCCLFDGKVYARTHGQEAGHDSFTWVKGFYSAFKYSPLLDGVSLFGENLQGVHSIEYDGLSSFFYAFAARKEATGEWLAWDALQKLLDDVCEETGVAVPLVPVVRRGVFSSMVEVEALMNREAARPSAVGRTREGFVLRVADAIPGHEFSRKVAKYVRKGHVQTKPDWRRTWKQATLAEPSE